MEGVLLTVDPHAFARQHKPCTAGPTSATARLLRSYLQPEPAALGTIAAATRRDPVWIATLTLKAVPSNAAQLAGLYRLPAHFRSLVRAQLLARQQTDPEPTAPLFVSADGTPATAQRLAGWLTRITSDAGLSFNTIYGASAEHSTDWMTITSLRAPLAALA